MVIIVIFIWFTRQTEGGELIDRTCDDPEAIEISCQAKAGHTRLRAERQKPVAAHFGLHYVTASGIVKAEEEGGHARIKP